MAKKIVTGEDGKQYEMKEKKPIFKKWWFWIIVVIIVVGGIGSMGDKKDKPVASENQATQASSEKPKEEPERNAKLGEAVPFEKTEVALLEVQVLDKVGTQYLEKAVSDGGVFVAVVWQMKNISDKPVGMFEHPSIKLIDDKGTEYSSDIGASGYYSSQKEVDNSKVVSDLNPGITVKDTAVFEVSKEMFNQGTWKIKFEDGGKSKLVDLN